MLVSNASEEAANVVLDGVVDDDGNGISASGIDELGRVLDGPGSGGGRPLPGAPTGQVDRGTTLAQPSQIPRPTP